RAPVYIQVIQYFKIASGELESGGEIPSRRQLANMLKINPNTMQKAYKEMEEAGLAFTDRNMPSRVTEDEAVIKQVRESLLQDVVENFIRLDRKSTRLNSSHVSISYAVFCS